ncbi:MAG TPA: hypothetical protein VMZ91_10390 [Candidatus Paceibacterota bacterium]|nr:hypothetical protein [Candidatus Paceibacterota bacterium]
MNKINILNVWILIGFCWIVPQIIIKYLPEGLQMLKPVILILLGFWVWFDKSFENFMLKSMKGGQNANRR